MKLLFFLLVVISLSSLKSSEASGIYLKFKCCNKLQLRIIIFYLQRSILDKKIHICYFRGSSRLYYIQRGMSSTLFRAIRWSYFSSMLGRSFILLLQGFWWNSIPHRWICLWTSRLSSRCLINKNWIQRPIQC